MVEIRPGDFLEIPPGERCMFCGVEYAFAGGDGLAPFGVRACFPCATNVLPGFLAGLAMEGEVVDREHRFVRAQHVIAAFEAAYWRAIAATIGR